MQRERPFVLSIAGFDPSAGAGVLADIKTFEQHRVYGFGVCSALTVQNDTEFIKIDWLQPSQILDQIRPLTAKFTIAACKIGLIQNSDALWEITGYLKQCNPKIKIVLDPVWKASAGFEFHTEKKPEKWMRAFANLDLVTPNFNELQQLGIDDDPYKAARSLSVYCGVLLKGGHNLDKPGTDFLFDEATCLEISPDEEEVSPKHGSGCVLSAAITSQLALGHSIMRSCRLAKSYIETFLNSNKTLLGYHHD